MDLLRFFLDFRIWKYHNFYPDFMRTWFISLCSNWHCKQQTSGLFKWTFVNFEISEFVSLLSLVHYQCVQVGILNNKLLNFWELFLIAFNIAWKFFV